MATEGGREADQPKLTAELFERDSDHTAYWQAATDLLLNQPVPPEWIRAVALNHLAEAAERTGINLDRWARDIDETFRTAFALVRLEDWSDLDGDRITELADACFEATNEARRAVGSEALDGDDFNSWMSVLLSGVVHEMAEWEPLASYLQSRGAWERLEWLRPTFETIGQHLSKVRDEDQDMWQAFAMFAWRDGMVLGVLEKAGIMTEPVPGTEPIHSEGRPLTGEPYESDPFQYQMTAAELVGATAHRVPEVAKRLYWHLAELSLLDSKLAKRYGKWLQDTYEAAYVLTQSEAWAEFDREEALSLIDRGLLKVAKERDTRDPEMLVRDPEYRIRNVALGLAAGMYDLFPGLLDYMESQPSASRINAMGASFIEGALGAGAIKGRHKKGMHAALIIAWGFGSAVGVLDLLGEIPSEMPTQLP